MVCRRNLQIVHSGLDLAEAQCDLVSFDWLGPRCSPAPTDGPQV